MKGEHEYLSLPLSPSRNKNSQFGENQSTNKHKSGRKKRNSTIQQSSYVIGHTDSDSIAKSHSNAQSNNNQVFVRRRLKPFNTSLIAQKNIQMQNNRLLKRLGQINKRRNKYSLSNIYSEHSNSNYYDSDSTAMTNLKSRHAYRLQREKQIQQQNDDFVHRLVTRLNSYKSVIDPDGITFKYKRKSKQKHKKSRKKHDSFALPSIEREIKKQEIQIK